MSLIGRCQPLEFYMERVTLNELNEAERAVIRVVQRVTFLDGEKTQSLRKLKPIVVEGHP